MGSGYLLDSNIISGYLTGKISTSGMEILSAIVDQTPHIPDIELLNP